MDDVIGNMAVSKTALLGSSPSPCAKNNGSVAEWFIATVLKTVVWKRTVSSNLTTSTQ